MIRRHKDFDSPPARLLDSLCNQKLANALQERHEHKAADNCYKHATVREQLDGIYNGKCGYCEALVSGSTLRVDHHRPCKQHRASTTPPAEQHDGYYWLAYEWSNLVYACDTCNRKKSTQFPIAAPTRRVTEPPLDEAGKLDRHRCVADRPPLCDEEPLLLHPEFDEPTAHLVPLPDGSLVGATERGRETIAVCKLERDGLLIARKGLVDEWVSEVRRALYKCCKSQVSAQELQRHLDACFATLLRGLLPEKPFSRVSWLMYRRFDVFVLPAFPPVWRTVLRSAFTDFKRRHPPIATRPPG